MRLHDLRPVPGSVQRRRIVGRGVGSGRGGQCGRGMKGQTSRSGNYLMPGFEGGQMSILRRIPKRGFGNGRFRREVAVVNLEQLEKAFREGSAANPEEMRQRGLVRKDLPIKVLGDGKFSKKLTVSAHAFSASAKTKIEAAGGTVEVLPAP